MASVINPKDERDIDAQVTDFKRKLLAQKYSERMKERTEQYGRENAATRFDDDGTLVGTTVQDLAARDPGAEILIDDGRGGPRKADLTRAITENLPGWKPAPDFKADDWGDGGRSGASNPKEDKTIRKGSKGNYYLNDRLPDGELEEDILPGQVSKFQGEGYKLMAEPPVPDKNQVRSARWKALQKPQEDDSGTRAELVNMPRPKARRPKSM